VFENREEAEAARLSAQMNGDPWRKANFFYGARELPSALLYRRAALPRLGPLFGAAPFLGSGANSRLVYGTQDARCWAS
jgi:hypothetical protein